MRILPFLLSLLPIVLAAKDFYTILGIDKGASEKELKRAYRALSKKYHPDKNPGDDSAHTKFVELAEAYEALSDPDSRRVYDQYGYEGLKQHQNGGGGGQHHDPFDLFSRFFGGGGHFNQGQRRGPNMEVKVQVPLKDFYTGNRVEFSIEKQGICEDCEGSGSRDGKTERCDSCQGRGVKIMKHMLAPGIFQQVQQVCDRCGGKGQKIKNPCKICKGARVVRKVVTHNLDVERGCPNGVRVSFDNEADESPDYVAGDLIVIVEQKQPDVNDNKDGHDGFWFRRRGSDLIWKETLSLREALLGEWKRNLTHLDGHEVVLSRKKGEVVQPGYVEVVQGQGLPKWNENDNYGNLLVEYTVILPDKMESGMRKDIHAIFEKWRKKVGVDMSKDEL